MVILGIETTCDETSVGIVKDGVEVLSNIVSSSVSLHQKYGGIVPEVAAREQVRLMVPVVDEALSKAGMQLEEIDAIAVAHGPGLVGSLLIGVETAKTLSLVWRKPLIGVNHLIGHLYANWSSEKGSGIKVKPKFPLVALIVSGGHTDLVLMEDVGKFRLLGSTRDDSAGEVFDKVARVLGLGYPGGPEIERVARSSKSQVSNYIFPRPMIHDETYDFSFSGLKTSVVDRVKRSSFTKVSEDKLELKEKDVSEIASEFQKAIVDVLVSKTLRAAKEFGAKSIVVGGGVAANNLLRHRLTDECSKIDIPIFFPSKSMSVDNGAMIAIAAYWEKNLADPLKLQALPNLHF